MFFISVLAVISALHFLILASRASYFLVHIFYHLKTISASEPEQRVLGAKSERPRTSHTLVIFESSLYSSPPCEDVSRRLDFCDANPLDPPFSVLWYEMARLLSESNSTAHKTCSQPCMKLDKNKWQTIPRQTISRRGR